MFSKKNNVIFLFLSLILLFLFPITQKESSVKTVDKSIYIGSTRKSFIKADGQIYPTTELIIRTTKKGDKIKIEKYKTTNLFNTFAYKIEYKINNLMGGA